MPLNDLTDNHREMIAACMNCIASGDVIEHDGEFATIMEVSIEQFLKVCSDWPSVDESDEVVHCAIGNGLNTLLGYPHHAHEDWDATIPVTKSDIATSLARWRGSSTASYFEGLR